MSFHPNDAARRELARQLHGSGIEFGPGCFPLPLGPFVDAIRYCDALDRAAFGRLFPEIGPDARRFPDHIDYRIDFDKEDFVERIGKGSADFLIANHVLEHLVNPIRFLEQCHALLRDDGLLFLGQPDKRRSFDADRQRTLLADVVRRYRANETVLSEARIRQYIHQVERPDQGFEPGVPGYAREIDRHRARSLHVNVWVIDDVLELFDFLAREMELPWKLVDGIVAGDEFLLIYRKSDDVRDIGNPAWTLSRIGLDSLSLRWEAEYVSRLERLDQIALSIHERLMILDERAREMQSLTRWFKGLARRIPGSSWIERAFRRGPSGGDPSVCKSIRDSLPSS